MSFWASRWRARCARLKRPVWIRSAIALLCLADVHGDLVLGSSFHAPQDKAIFNVLAARVDAYRPLTLTVCEQRFRVESPQFCFRPGQYMIFHIHHENFY